MSQDQRDILQEHLSLYFIPPDLSVNLEVLYKVTNQRYKLLKVIADYAGNKSKENNLKYIDSITAHIKEQENLQDFNNLINCFWENVDELRNLRFIDEVSHFCLRLACSRSYESIRWFICNEIKLLHIRWYHLSMKQKENFLEANNFLYDKVSCDELSDLKRRFGSDFLEGCDLFKVKFSEVSDLVRFREVVTYKSISYLALNQIIYAVDTYFYNFLNQCLKKVKNRYYKLLYDSRITPFFRRISNEIRLTYYNISSMPGATVNINEINQLAKDSFPLCMEVLHYNLIKNNHLRNSGRFQYNLFLKGIGLPLIDAIKFWKDFFTKKMTLEMFLKKYLYGVRHGFGKLGKQANYPPLSCKKILEATPGPLDHHGCPFNTSYKDIISHHLKRNNINDKGIEEIWNLMEKGLPQMGCARMFEIKHSVQDHPATCHPNLYFKDSREIIIRCQGEITKEGNGSKNCRCDNKTLEW